MALSKAVMVPMLTTQVRIRCMDREAFLAPADRAKIGSMWISPTPDANC
jgi:hypothetical protein